MENKDKKDKVMKSALMVLVVIVVVFAGLLIFAGSKTNTPDRVVQNNDVPSGKRLIDLDDLGLSKAIVNVGGVHLTASVANTQSSRTRGLSNVHSIGPNEGKLFIFEEEDYHAIWAKDMNFAIDIVWINNNGTVVDFAQNVMPDSYPKSFTPKYPASKVIEVNAGWVEQQKIKVGDQMIWTTLR